MVVGRGRTSDTGDGGQVTFAALVVVAIVLSVLVALGRLGSTLIATARAEAAADATALAAVQAGPVAARRVAAGNGATVRVLRTVPGWAQVTVVVDGREASATAILTPAG